MLRLRHLGLLLALLLCSAPVAAKPPEAWAYMGWWLPDSWRSTPLDQLDRLLFFDLKISATGEITERNGWPEKWTDLRLAVKQHNTPLDLTLTLFDVSTFEKLFASGQSTQRLLDECLSLAGQEGVAGLQLDFEIYTLVRPDAIARYRSFILRLSKGLRELSIPRSLSVFFPMGSESQLYDAPTLQQVDRLVLQGYDSHWKGGKTAGPVAPLNGEEAVTWKKAVALGLALGMPRERLLLGFPLYGYEWPVQGSRLRSATVGEGSATTFAPMPAGLLSDFPFNIQDQVRQHGATHDPASGSSYYQFKKDNGQFVEGWFEDWWTLDFKSNYLKSEQLGGIAFFMLGYDHGQLGNHFLQRRSSPTFEGLINDLQATDSKKP